MIKSISASELSSIVASGKNIDLIDVRTPMEFRAMHVTIARNEPLSGLGKSHSDARSIVCGNFQAYRQDQDAT
ncbi:MAG: hypothetical protein WCK15_04630 [Pirellula sp.]